jgi:nickel-dependent lactate racemase
MSHQDPHRTPTNVTEDIREQLRNMIRRCDELASYQNKIVLARDTHWRVVMSPEIARIEVNQLQDRANNLRRSLGGLVDD